MKKETKACLIIFIAVFVLGYVMTLFIPDSVLAYSTEHTTLLSTFGSSVAKLVGMRVIIAVAIALAVTLLIRIVDSEDKTETVKKEPEKKTRRVAKKKES